MAEMEPKRFVMQENQLFGCTQELQRRDVRRSKLMVVAQLPDSSC
jgi:hypothetical protein